MILVSFTFRILDVLLANHAASATCATGRSSLAHRGDFQPPLLLRRGAVAAHARSKRPDLRSSRKVGTPWSPSRPQRCPERFIRFVTRTLLAGSTAPGPMASPASAASARFMRRRFLRKQANSFQMPSAPFPFRSRWRRASITLPAPLGSWRRTCRHLSNRAVPSAVSGPKVALAAALRCRVPCQLCRIRHSWQHAEFPTMPSVVRNPLIPFALPPGFSA